MAGCITSESSFPSPPAPLLPRGVFGGSAIERSCAYDERGAMTLAQECTSWCSQQRDIVCAKGEQRDARQDGNVEHIQRHEGDQCGDAIGQAVASERKRLQDSAVKARRRAIEKMLDGDRESAAAQVASIICVTKEECNMERVIAEAIDAIVNSEKIREETIEKGFNFIQKIANSSKIVQEWDTIFEKFSNEYEITKNTSKLKIGLLEVLYLASNRLHSRKISKIFK